MLVSNITWIMKWHQSEVIQRFLGPPQGCFQDLGGALDHLHQVVVHGAGHVKDEGQRGRPLRDGLVAGCRDPGVLPGAHSRWQRQAEPQQTAAHRGVKTLHHKKFLFWHSRCVRVRPGCRAAQDVEAFAFLRTSCCSLSRRPPRCELNACSCTSAAPVVCSVRSLFQPVMQRPPLSWAVCPRCVAPLWLDEKFLVTSGDLARKRHVFKHRPPN